ncbi:hypothetical protein [Aquisphaera insulae]|uniref:hypothetical protein n=1 Tax=Aquisphaera insulae TaxID=2712864 RepID=UPI0013ECB5C8|nr:hypothetical protein [Aquisphaera insulae]
MVFVRHREEGREDRGEGEVTTEGIGPTAVEEPEDEQEQDGELGGVPALNDGEPASAPEHREPTQTGLVPEDVRGQPGEEVVGHDDRAGRGGDQAGPDQGGQEPGAANWSTRRRR